MKKFMKLLLLTAMIFAMFTMLTGCLPKPFDTPEYIELTSSQTGILVPMDGDNSLQGQTNSMEMLEDNLVSDKRVEIPHKWIKTGRNFLGIKPVGKYVDTHKLLIVERKPETREWVGAEDKGTATVDQGIETESMDSIGFEIGVGITAMIKEEDAVLFLNSYSNKPLASILDQEVRTRVESKFNEEFGMLPLEAVMASKATILNSVKADVVEHFAKTGITITNLGMKGQLSYSDPAIQNAINEKFQAEKEKQKQVEVNSMNEDKALTDRTIELAKVTNEKQLAIVEAETLKIRESVLTIQMKLKELEIKEIIAQRWNGTYPDTLFIGSDDSSFLLELPVGN